MADDGASLVTITLPAAPTVGDIIQVVGIGAGGWTIAQNAGQTTILDGITGITGTTGAISGGQYAAIELQYIGGNTFTVLNHTAHVGVLLSSGYVYEGGLTWMPISSTTYEQLEAATFCAGTINGLSGWRLPTEPELSALYSTYPNVSAALTAQGWTLSNTWSSTPSSLGHYILNAGTVFDIPDASWPIYATCVR